MEVGEPIGEETVYSARMGGADPGRRGVRGTGSEIEPPLGLREVEPLRMPAPKPGPKVFGIIDLVGRLVQGDGDAVLVPGDPTAVLWGERTSAVDQPAHEPLRRRYALDLNLVPPGVPEVVLVATAVWPMLGEDG